MDSDDCYELKPTSARRPTPATARDPDPAVAPPVLPPRATLAPARLGYVTPGVLPGRPGVLTALAVIGICLGLLSIAVSGATTWFWVLAWARSQPPAPPSPGAPLPAASVQPFGGRTVGARGWPAERRRKLVRSLPLAGPFADDRRAMLDRLLAEVGQDVAPADKLAVITSRREERRQGEPVSPLWARQIFLLPSGRLNLDNTSCTFRAAAAARPQRSDGRRPGPVELRDTDFALEDNDVEISGSVVVTAQGRHWSVLAIDETLAELQRSLAAAPPGRTASPLQLAYLAQQIQRAAPEQRHHLSFDVPFRSHEAVLDEHQMLTARIGPEIHYVLGDGRGVSSKAAPHGVDPTTGRTNPPPPPPYTPWMPGNPLLMLALGVHAAATAGLAVLLISASIWLLAGSPRALFWLAGWARGKLALVLLELVLSLAFVLGIDDAVGAPGAGRAAASTVQFDAARGVISTVFGVALQLIFPAAVLGVLSRSAGVAAYLNSRGAASPRPGALRLAVADWFRVPPRAAWTGVLLLAALAAAHLASAWRTARGPEGLTVGSTAAFLAALLAAVAALAGTVWFMRQQRRPPATAPVVASLIAVGTLLSQLAAAAPAPRQPRPNPGAKPATETAATPAAKLTPDQVAARAEALSRRMTHLDAPGYWESFEEMVRLGEPAMEHVLRHLQQVAQPAMVDIVVREWGAQRIMRSAAARKRLLEVAPQLVDHWHDGSGKRLLALLDPEPRLTLLLIPRCFTPLPERRQAAVRALLANDPRAEALIAVAVERAGARSATDRRIAVELLRELGELGRPGLLELTHSPSADVRMEALVQLAPRDNSCPPDVRERATELLFDPGTGLVQREPARPHGATAGSVRDAAVAVLASDPESRPRLVELLDGPDALATDVRARIMSTLSERVESLGRVAVAWHLLPAEQWPAAQRVARLHVVPSADAAADLLALLHPDAAGPPHVVVPGVIAAAEADLLRSEHLAQVAQAMRQAPPDMRVALFKAASESPRLAARADVRRLAAELLASGPGPQFAAALGMLAAGGPQGRAALHQQLAVGRNRSPHLTRPVIDALCADVPYTFAPADLAQPASDWERAGYRGAVLRLVRTGEKLRRGDNAASARDPAAQRAAAQVLSDGIAVHLLKWLSAGSTDERLVAARALRASRQFPQLMGVETRRRIDAVLGPVPSGGARSPPGLGRSMAPVAAVGRAAPRLRGRPIAAPAWLATALALPLVLGLAILIRGGGSEQ